MSENQEGKRRAGERLMPAHDLAHYVLALNGTLCFCGRKKGRKLSFCSLCHRSLPAALRRDLWKPLRDGYEEAVDAAEDFLKQKQTVLPEPKLTLLRQ